MLHNHLNENSNHSFWRSVIKCMHLTASNKTRKYTLIETCAHMKTAVSRVPVNLCTNLCYHMQAEGGVRAT